MTNKEQQHKDNTTNSKQSEHRPRKGLEDWELMQNTEEPPLKIPYWLPIIFGGLILFAVISTLPLLGVREGYERPWFDSGIFIGAGYGIVSLGMIYLFLRKKKDKPSKNDNTDKKK